VMEVRDNQNCMCVVVCVCVYAIHKIIYKHLLELFDLHLLL